MRLRRGDSGPGVTSLQNTLIGLGFPLSADGAFGARTDDAVRGFQLVVGLPPDGEVGPATTTALASTAWADHHEALCFAALANIARTDTTTTALSTVVATADVKYPIALPDAYAAATAINPGLRALAESVVNTTFTDLMTPEDPFGPTTITGEIEPCLLSGSMFAVHGDLSEYFTGAAHPNNVVVTAVADLAANAFLRPSDLFMPGARWTTKLRTLTIAQFPDAEPGGVAASATNYRHLTLTPAGVKVVFEKYQILAGVAGAPSFIAPWTALSTVIRPSIVARCLGGSPGGPGPHVS